MTADKEAPANNNALSSSILEAGRHAPIGFQERSSRNRGFLGNVKISHFFMNRIIPLGTASLSHSSVELGFYATWAPSAEYYPAFEPT
jgi:hypothetical protein